jgi:hypothetical protein
LGYKTPDLVPREQGGIWSSNLTKRCFHPHKRVTVVADKSLADSSHIYIDEPLLVFANREKEEQLHLRIGKGQPNYYETEGIGSSYALKIGDALTIHFHRTVRMPDDDKIHHLPPSLGFFPLYNISAYADRLPQNIVEKGGIFLPIWSREALWMEFNSENDQKYAFRIYVGCINAVTGDSMDQNSSTQETSEQRQDYVVVPGQAWLDGICTEEGIVRQFVSMARKCNHIVQESSRRNFVNPRIWLPSSGFRLYS